MGVLHGRTALVTGGSRGLGWEMARGIAREGADVVIVSRKQQPCEERAEQIRSEFGVQAFARSCHVGDWAQCDALIDWVARNVGEIDVLVNNAGMSPLYPSVDQVEEALFDKVIATNLKGPFRLSAAFGARMAAGRGGSIINISSIEADRPTAAAVPYAAAKAGLNAMTAGLAQALGPAVRVNTIQAGPFLTDISQAWPADALEQIAGSFALERAGRPDEIVGAALFFATDASAYCTGSVLKLDGGPR
jgi:NAD(P)-dependent dehydrogenase (short-subunit alcohol dehydrogenase family)